MTVPTKLIIDTDPGVDDAMAIVYACLEPRIELLGLTSIFGNVTTDIATRNALVLLEMMETGLPVARGADKPLVQPSKEIASEVHGVEGFGDLPVFTPTGKAIDMPAHEFICEQVNKYPGEVVLCPIGPLTNIALALKHDPSIANKVKALNIMGGSIDEGGNVTSFAEANIWQDPHAANDVFSASWAVNMIGLDVTHRIVCSRDDFAGLARRVPKLGGFLNDAAQFYFDFHLEVDKLDGCHMHDPAAVISVIEPDLFTYEAMPVEVVEDGERVGATVRSNTPDQQPINVAVKVNSQAVKKEFLDRIASSY